MKDLIEFMARSIVDNPDAVVVTEEDAEDHLVYHLKVADGDMGRVIGKQGRVANAMRTLLKVAAIRQGARAVLEIGDDIRRDDRRGGYDRDDRGHDDDRYDDEDSGRDDHDGDLGDGNGDHDEFREADADDNGRNDDQDNGGFDGHDDEGDEDSPHDDDD
jgi:predicted RNA-binding protein YlqC (UPF0109 family)